MTDVDTIRADHEAILARGGCTCAGWSRRPCHIGVLLAAIARVEELCEQALLPGDGDAADWGAKNLAARVGAAIAGDRGLLDRIAGDTPTAAAPERHAFEPQPDNPEWCLVGFPMAACGLLADDPIHQQRPDTAGLYYEGDCPRCWSGNPEKECGCHRRCVSAVCGVTGA